MKLEKEKQGIVLQVTIEHIGNDLCVIVTGGTDPHIGSVSMSVPRTSLDHTGKISSTTSTYNFIGHKDDMISNLFSSSLAAAFDENVVVMCGIHIDNINTNSINLIQSLSQELLADSIQALSKEKETLISTH